MRSKRDVGLSPKVLLLAHIHCILASDLSFDPSELGKTRALSKEKSNLDLLAVPI